MSTACFHFQAPDQPEVSPDPPFTLKCICRISFCPLSLANCTSLDLFSFLVLPLPAHAFLLYLHLTVCSFRCLHLMCEVNEEIDF